MPFQIGQVFSPEALSLIERRREFDQQQALARSQFEMSRRAQGNDAANQARQLDLGYARLGGENEDRTLRRLMAQADNLRQNRSLDLNTREQTFRESQGAQQNQMEEKRFSEGQRQFGVESGMKNAELDYQKQHGNRALDLTQKSQEFEMGPGFDLKKKSAEAIDRYHTALADNTAQATTERAGASETRLLIDEMKAINSAITGGASGIPMDEKSAEYRKHVARVAQIMDKLRQRGIDPEKAVAEATAAPAADPEAAAMELMLGGKPPPVPRGR